MKVEQRPLEVISTLDDSDEVEMSFDQDSLKHLMGLLTNLYTDNILAVIREYSTNALDSHIEAGNPTPIEVSLPTAINRFFIVRDRGVGMSKDDILQRFSKYGYSSKRETNDQIGMLGLGCKSALAYTDQFTMECVKDGRKFAALIYRAEDRGVRVKVLTDTETDEPNGVTIKIMVRESDTQSFYSKAREFFRWWIPGTVLIDGLAPKQPDDLTWLEEDTFALQPSGHHEHPSLVVMGNVAYPISREHDPLVGNPHSHAVMFVPMGSVIPAPDREGLQYTPTTIETLGLVRQWATERTRRHFHELLEKCDSHVEAHEIAKQYRSTMFGKYGDGKYSENPLYFQSEPIPISNYIRHAHGFHAIIETEWDPRGNPKKIIKCAYEHANSSRTDDLPDRLVITHYPKKRMSLSDKEATLAFASAINLPTNRIVVFHVSDDIHDLRWISPQHQHKWDEIAKYRPTPTPQTATRAPKPQASKNEYSMLTADSNGHVSMEPSVPDESRPLIYTTTSDYSYEGMPPKGVLFRIVRTIDPDAQIAIVNKNRWGKLERNYPLAMHLGTFLTQDDVIRKFQAIYIGTLKQYLQSSRHIGYAINEKINLMRNSLGSRISQVHDPELKRLFQNSSKVRSGKRERLLKDIDTCYTHLRPHRGNEDFYIWWHREFSPQKRTEIFEKKADKYREMAVALLERYPLVTSSRTLYHGDFGHDAIIYVNAKYESIRGSKEAA